MPTWFKPRGYNHLDSPVGESFASKAEIPEIVSRHSWLPLIKYIKRTRRYKPGLGKTVFKDRPIMYASHRDACILSKFSYDLTQALEVTYANVHFGESVIAYRKLNKSNYDFSGIAYDFAQQNKPCVVLCFDVTGFFDHLDHAILKRSLKSVLGFGELPKDWYAVFKYGTKFKWIDREQLEKHPIFGPRVGARDRAPIAKIATVVSEGIPIHTNPYQYGIPQGTPISSALSNLYLLELDRAIATVCQQYGALYQRYSDDILIICKPTYEEPIRHQLLQQMKVHKLELSEDKTERRLFGTNSREAFQYLGFNVSEDGVVIRPSSLARQHRKLKRAIARTRKIGLESIGDGSSSTIYTKKLRRRFLHIGKRNFSSYARRAAKAFSKQRIGHQIRRFERRAEQEIRALKDLTP